MGSRAKSTIFYGVYWDENEYVFEDEEKEIDDYDVDEEIKLFAPSLEFAAIHSYETSYCLAVRESVYSGEWNDPTIINIDKIKNINKELADISLKSVCEQMGMRYKEPKLQMISSYF